MPRSNRVDVGGYTYHVINRAVGRLQIFNNPDDYLDFLKVMRETKEWVDVDIMAYTCMPNHFHLVIRTKEDKDLSKFMHRLTNMHTRHVHSKTETIGTGPLYQGRYKSFIVDSDMYLSTLLRYVERNPVRAGLVEFVEDWRWGSGWLRLNGDEQQIKLLFPLCDFNDDMYFPSDKVRYLNWINAIDINNENEIAVIRNSVNRGTPYGRSTWVSQMLDTHNLLNTVRNRGGQKKV